MKGNFNKLIESETPVLIDFFADWCSPCRIQGPILEKIAREMGDKLKVLKVNVDKNKALAARFQIRSVPTLIIFKKGKSVWRRTGVADKTELKQILQSHL